MRPTGASSVSAPSTTLLKFLRAQSRSTFFTPNSAPLVPLEHGAPRGISRATSTQLPTRRISTGRKCQASSFPIGDLDSLWSAAREPSYNVAFRSISSSMRHASTQSIFRRMLRLRTPRNPNSLQPADLPNRNGDPNYDSQFLNLTRSLARTGSGAETKLRCTEFDSNGSVTLVSGEFKKSELIAKYGLLPRDLRKIDSSLLPHILVRKSAILLNLLHLRVLIQADRVLVFDAYGTTDSYTQSLFMYDLEGKLRQKSDTRSSTYLPYEFRALEAVLISVTSGLESEFEGVRAPVVRVLQDLEEDIDRDKLRHLLIHSKKLGSFEQKARLVRDAISDLLDADDDLVDMYLTERAQGKVREEDDHQEVEMLLESYHKICDEIVESAGNLISNIRNTEEVIKAILDANRNSLMLLDLKFSIGTLGLAAGTLFAGLYGMNLKNFFEESDYAFSGVSAVCFGITGIFCLYGMRKLSRVQRLRMWGEGYNNTAYRPPSEISRGNWRNEAVESAGTYQAHLARAERTRKMKDAGSTRVMWPGMEGLGNNSDALDGAAYQPRPAAGESSDTTPSTKPEAKPESKNLSVPAKK